MSIELKSSPMKRPSLKQFLEAKRRLLDHRIFNSVRHRLHAETLWHLNKRSLAGGLAAGLFAAFIPFPLQMLIAAGLAIAWQANMPVALVSTWVSNPLTYAPIFYSNYKIGLYVLGLFHPIQTAVIEHEQSILTQIGDIGGPFLLGSFCAAFMASLTGYVAARAIWRIITLRKLYRRRSIRKLKKASRL